MLLTPEQAQAIIDAWDEGRVSLSTGRQEEVAQGIVYDLQEQLYAGVQVLAVATSGWDVQLTMLQLLEAI